MGDAQGAYVVTIQRPYLITAAIDVGICKCGVTIVRKWQKDAPNCPLDGQEDVGDGEKDAEDEVEDDDGVRGCLSGRWEVLYAAKWYLTEGSPEGGKKLTKKTLQNLYIKIKSIERLLMQVDRVYIEEQFFANDIMRQLQGYFFSFFIRGEYEWHKAIEIIRIPSRLKTQWTGCPKGSKKSQYKPWCHKYAVKRLRQEKQDLYADWLDSLTIEEGKFDVGDSFCMQDIGDLYFSVSKCM